VLAWDCQAELFRQEVEDADDIRLNVRLFKGTCLWVTTSVLQFCLICLLLCSFCTMRLVGVSSSTVPCVTT